MKKVCLLLTGIFLLFITTHAQTSKGKPAKPKATSVRKKVTGTKQSKPSTTINAGWTTPEREYFIEACLKELTWSKDSSTRYCNCMLQKIENLYPSAAASDKLSDEEALAMAKDCIAFGMSSTSWGANERTEFIKQCEASASKGAGAEKAKAYCACMLPKVEKACPNPNDLVKMTQETVVKLAEECAKQ